MRAFGRTGMIITAFISLPVLAAGYAVLVEADAPPSVGTITVVSSAQKRMVANAQPTAVSPSGTVMAAALVPTGDVPTTYLPPAGWLDHQPFGSTGWQEIDVTNPAQVGAANVVVAGNVNDTVQKIKAIANSSNAPRILKFPPGTYYLKDTLVLNNSYLVIKGAGKGQTIFKIAATADKNAEIAFVGGGYSTTEVDVTNVPVRGDDYLLAASTAGLAVGDFVRVYDKNRGTGIGGQDWQQLARITSISGNRLNFERKFGISFNGTGSGSTLAGDPKFKKMNYITHVGFSSFSVTRDVLPATGAPNLRLAYTNKSYVGGVDVARLDGSGIKLQSSYDVSVRQSSVHDTVNPDTTAGYGGGGKAYGIDVGAVTGCAIVDNKLWNLRHHIILSIGTNHCVVAYNSTESGYFGESGDLSHHGFTPHNNLWEGNMGANLKWDGRSDLPPTGGPDRRESSGMYNVAYRNLANRTVPTYNCVAGGFTVQQPNEPGNYGHYGLTVIGNVVPRLLFQRRASGSCYWVAYDGADIPKIVGANIVNGVLRNEPGTSLPLNGSYPPSLYLTAKPGFLGAKPWPLFGPGVSGYGTSNTLPAADRPKS